MSEASKATATSYLLRLLASLPELFFSCKETGSPSRGSVGKIVEG
ncbi:hypothetical protein ACSAZL_21765 [Methanosarcina sp. T3]